MVDAPRCVWLAVLLLCYGVLQVSRRWRQRAGWKRRHACAAWSEEDGQHFFSDFLEFRSTGKLATMKISVYGNFCTVAPSLTKFCLLCCA